MLSRSFLLVSIGALAVAIACQTQVETDVPVGAEDFVEALRVIAGQRDEQRALLHRTAADHQNFHRRARLSNDDPATWVPDGFEVKITGLSGSRKVWMHLVVESPGGKGIVGVQSNTVIAHPRDL